MDPLLGLEILAVIAAWGLVLRSIRRWGPGYANRRVRCPEKKVRAKVRVEQREGDFGTLVATDVVACSLLPGQPVTCDKDCLKRL